MSDELREIKFEFGTFNYKTEEFQIPSGVILISRGTFSLISKPIMQRDFLKEFSFYNVDSKLLNNTNIKKGFNLNEIYSLGPYYPKHVFEEDKEFLPALQYPIFSEVLFNSKTGPLQKLSECNIDDRKKEFIKLGRIEELKIISNFFGTILAKSIGNSYDLIIPTPAKPEYNFNSIEIISNEFSRLWNIPCKNDIFKRISQTDKRYQLNLTPNNVLKKNILIVDDILTQGETCAILCDLLKEHGANRISLITLGLTDHNIYEY